MGTKMEKRKVKAKSKEINFDLVEIKAMQESLSQVLTIK